MDTGAGNKLILPDSRTKESIGSQMTDWELPGGRIVRIEVVQIYCANCGKPYGFVPKDNTGFACFLCGKCFQVYGEVAGTYAVPDDAFNAAVQEEMERRFGRDLTDAEANALAASAGLGRELELLARESPYPIPTHPNAT
jgi:hypothetical protein